MAVYQLIYRSVAIRLLSDEELARLVEQSRIHNYSQGITGVLFYAEGRFLQVLEGEMEPVKVLYECIWQDSRHTEVVKLFSGPVAQRLFAGWSLGFGQVAPPALARLDAYLDPEHQAALLPSAYNIEAFIADTIQEFVRDEFTVTGRQPQR
ncbi:hypothetical protein GCM10028824_00540 [Hymenobacter segetis]|uniref:BLUF domain-containing protein n=1 Tax=Hymenobacter segetis TaxID=2025509 RepID=A0ABU9M000_9BACT